MAQASDWGFGWNELASLVGIFVLIVGALVGTFVLFRFAPLQTLRIVPRWSEASTQLLVIRYEIQNGSQVRLSHPVAEAQVLKYPIEAGRTLSAFVPFNEAEIKEDEKPLEWTDPISLLGEETMIYPGEVISVETAHDFREEDALLLHVGLQLRAELKCLGKLFLRARSPWSQTATCFVVKPKAGSGPR